jgi:membrane protein
MTARQGLQLFTSAFARWNYHDAPRLGAALAYYTLLSVAPLTLIVVTICGFVFGHTTAEQHVLAQVRSFMGANGADTLRMLIDNMRRETTGVWATFIAVVTLFFGASGVFTELQSSLNTIWDTAPPASSTWLSIVWQRLIAFGMVLAVGVLLLASLLLSAALAVIEKFFSGVVPISSTGLEILNLGFSGIAIAALFALIFKYVPDTPISWHDVSIGAVVTAILFTLGKLLLAWYLRTAAVGSAYGAAGSLVALVVWIYYSAQIFLYGAVFTREYAGKFGTHARSPAGKTGVRQIGLTSGKMGSSP